MVFRVFVPLVAAKYYAVWMMISGTFWIIGFTIFVLIYAPILVKSRLDGAYG